MVKYEVLTPQCGRSVCPQYGYRSGDLCRNDTTVLEFNTGVQVLVVRVNIGVVICEVITPQCGPAMEQVLVVRVDIGLVTYEAMTLQCGRSVVQVLVVSVDIAVVIYEVMTPQCGRSVAQVMNCQCGYSSGFFIKL